MKAVKIFACIMVLALLLCPIYLAYAVDLQKTAEEMKQTAEEKMMPETGKAASKPSVCSAEHMQMMLKEDADKACVIDGVLKDDTARGMVMDKIAADPQMRKTMMEKCTKMEKMKMPMHEGMMKEGGMMPGQGGTTK